MGAVAARSLERKGPALLFENVKGYRDMPLVTNMISTTKQLAIAFNTEADEETILKKVVEGMTYRIPSVTAADRAVQGCDRHRRRYRYRHHPDALLA